MTSGTTLFAFKQAVIEGLNAVAELDGVSVTYGYPSNNGQDAITDRAVWFENADADGRDPVMKAGARHLDEDYKVTLVVQALGDQGEDQEATDAKAGGLLSAIQRWFAFNPQPAEDAGVQWAVIDGWRHRGGVLANDSGTGSRFEVRVKVRARLMQ